MPSEYRDIITLSCRKCGNSYRIRKERIPAGATGVRCKACGKRLRLTSKDTAKVADEKTINDGHPAENPVEKPAISSPRCRLDLMTEEKRHRPRRRQRSKKPWAL